MKILTVLKSGGDFELFHVKRIQEMLDRHHDSNDYELYCLTDYSEDMMPTDKIQHIPLQYDWPGWWSKIEMFSIESNELFLYMDLDTVITGNLSHLFEVETSFSPIQDVFQRLQNKERMGSGLFLFRPNYLRFLFRKFHYTPQKYMKQFRGDQDFIENSIDLNNYTFLQNMFSNQIFSFKGDLCDPPKSKNPENFVGIPNNSKIIFFHGIPRPSDPQVNYLNQAKN